VQAVFTQAHEYNIIERDGIFFFTKTNTLASSVSKEQILIFRNAIIKSCQHILQQHKNAITKESDPKIQVQTPFPFSNTLDIQFINTRIARVC